MIQTWTYLVIGLGKQVHFSQSMNNVIRNITKPDAKKTRNLESVLKYYFFVNFLQLFCLEVAMYLRGYCNNLQDVEADVNENRTSKISFQHFIPLLAVSFLKRRILLKFCLYLETWSEFLLFVLLLFNPQIGTFYFKLGITFYLWVFN